MHNIFDAQTPQIMGIVNVTPDSFSDGGQYFNPDKAIEHGLKLLEEGADILDIGGESTRPGAKTVDIDEEIRRVIPVIKGLKGQAKHISIDTRNARTMTRALDAGATIINDVSALTHDKNSVAVASDARCSVILMHAQGAPVDMQKNPIYNNAVKDISQFFKMRIDHLVTHRIETKNLILDPGIGFGKTFEHNLLIIRNIKKFLDLECPIMLGASRKSFITAIQQEQGRPDRLGGSIASALWGLENGVQFFRVHDVAQTRQAFNIYNAIKNTDKIS